MRCPLKGNIHWWKNRRYSIKKKNLKEKVISINMSKELESWTVYALTSLCIFSILFSIHFLQCCQRELFRRSRASLIGDRFLYSCDHNICETTPSASHWLQNVKSVLTYLLRCMPQIRRQTMSKINTWMGHRTWYLLFLPFFFFVFIFQSHSFTL